MTVACSAAKLTSTRCGQSLKHSPEREAVHRIIYDELCRGQVLPASRETYRQVMANLVSRGAQAIILGCTEISLLVSDEDCEVPLFDTTAIHARRAVELALAKT